MNSQNKNIISKSIYKKKNTLYIILIISMLEYFPKTFFRWLGELETDFVGYYLGFHVESLVVSYSQTSLFLHRIINTYICNINNYIRSIATNDFRLTSWFVVIYNIVMSPDGTSHFKNYKIKFFYARIKKLVLLYIFSERTRWKVWQALCGVIYNNKCL